MSNVSKKINCIYLITRLALFLIIIIGIQSCSIFPDWQPKKKNDISVSIKSTDSCEKTVHCLKWENPTEDSTNNELRNLSLEIIRNSDKTNKYDTLFVGNLFSNKEEQGKRNFEESCDSSRNLTFDSNYTYYFNYITERTFLNIDFILYDSLKFDSKQPKPKPVEILKANYDSINRVIEISWNNPTKDINNQDLDEYTITIHRKCIEENCNENDKGLDIILNKYDNSYKDKSISFNRNYEYSFQVVSSCGCKSDIISTSINTYVVDKVIEGTGIEAIAGFSDPSNILYAIKDSNGTTTLYTKDMLDDTININDSTKQIKLKEKYRNKSSQEISDIATQKYLTPEIIAQKDSLKNKINKQKDTTISSNADSILKKSDSTECIVPLSTKNNFIESTKFLINSKNDFIIQNNNFRWAAIHLIDTVINKKDTIFVSPISLFGTIEDFLGFDTGNSKNSLSYPIKRIPDSVTIYRAMTPIKLDELFFPAFIKRPLDELLGLFGFNVYQELNDFSNNIYDTDDSINNKLLQLQLIDISFELIKAIDTYGAIEMCNLLLPVIDTNLSPNKFVKLLTDSIIYNGKDYFKGAKSLENIYSNPTEMNDETGIADVILGAIKNLMIKDNIIQFASKIIAFAINIIIEFFNYIKTAVGNFLTNKNITLSEPQLTLQDWHGYFEFFNQIRKNIFNHFNISEANVDGITKEKYENIFKVKIDTKDEEKFEKFKKSTQKYFNNATKTIKKYWPFVKVIEIFPKVVSMFIPPFYEKVPIEIISFNNSFEFGDTILKDSIELTELTKLIPKIESILECNKNLQLVVTGYSDPLYSGSTTENDTNKRKEDGANKNYEVAESRGRNVIKFIQDSLPDLKKRIVQGFMPKYDSNDIILIKDVENTIGLNKNNSEKIKSKYASKRRVVLKFQLK